jgi:hypothetical protein
MVWGLVYIGPPPPLAGEPSSPWLPFLNTYRTMCTAPSPDFLQALEGISALWVVA